MLKRIKQWAAGSLQHSSPTHQFWCENWSSTPLRSLRLQQVWVGIHWSITFISNVAPKTLPPFSENPFSQRKPGRKDKLCIVPSRSISLCSSNQLGKASSKDFAATFSIAGPSCLSQQTFGSHFSAALGLRQPNPGTDAISAPARVWMPGTGKVKREPAKINRVALFSHGFFCFN